MLLVTALVPISQLLWSLTLPLHLPHSILMESFQRWWDQGREATSPASVPQTKCGVVCVYGSLMASLNLSFLSTIN